MRSKQWLWFPAVSAAAILQTAGGTPWPETALMALLAFALLCLPREETSPKWLEALQGLWNGVILSQVLRWASGYWPEAPIWAAGILLALGLWLAGKGAEAMMTTASVLGLMQLFLTGGVLLAALPEVRPQNWVWQMPKGNGWLLTALLIPSLTSREKNLGSGLWALLISLVTTGVVPAAGGYYVMSKSIALFGSIRRLEALAAVGLTLGFLLLGSRLMESEKKGYSLLTAAVGFLLFAAPLSIGGPSAALGSVIIWNVLPTISHFVGKKGIFCRTRNGEKEN